MTFAAIGFGLLIGLAVGTLGGGGSVLALPVLAYVLEQDVAQATTTSLVVGAASALAGGLAHHREGHVCWRQAGVFTLAAVPGIFGGTAAGDAVGARALLAAFALLLLGAAYATWRRAEDGDPAPDTAAESDCPPVDPRRSVAAGLLVGFLAGFFGVGGGVLIVPILAIGLAFPFRSAIGTSLAIVTATSLVGLVVHLLAGRTLEAGVTTAMAAACVAGALAGTALTTRVPARELGRGFAVLITAVAGYLLVSTAFLGGPPAP